jgi:predicted methyltransferase
MTIRPCNERTGLTAYHGDCLAVVPTLASESVDFVLTDPLRTIVAEGVSHDRDA